MAKQTVDNTALEQLKTDLKQDTLGSFYVFYGEEAYLRTHYLERVKKKLIDEFTEAFNFHRYNEETISPEALGWTTTAA